jgi:nitrogenase molybdenum-iron protein beta chain
MSSVIEQPRYQCALGGALATISSLPRTCAIIHAAPGCGSSTDGAAMLGSGYWGPTYCNGRGTPSSNTQEREVVFGGEDRLSEQIRATLRIIDADLFAVITGCMTDIIGDDVSAVVREFQHGDHALVVAETGGFKGNSAKGYELIWDAFITQYVEKELPVDPVQVNLLGLIPAQNVFWRGDLLEIKRLLTALGLKVNTFFTPFDTLEQLHTASAAALNIVLSDVHGQATAEKFAEVHGTPSLTLPIPIGPTASRAFLEAVAQRFSIAEQRVQQVITEENAYYFTFIQHLAECYNDLDLQRYAFIVGDSTYALALTQFLAQDLGWIPFVTAITDLLTEDEEQRVLARFAALPAAARPTVIFETDSSQIIARAQARIAEEPQPYGGNPIEPSFVLGSTLDRNLAAAFNAGLLTVTYPVTNRVITDQGYAGYRGGLRLATELLSVILSPR